MSRHEKPEVDRRSRERSRAMRVAGVSGAGFRLLNVGVLLVTTPILVRALGEASFGMFVTITALTAYLALSDLGIGASLLTVLGQASGSQDHRRMAGLVTNAWWMMLAAGSIVIAVGLTTSVVFDIPRLLGAPPGDELEALVAYRIFVIGFGIGIPLSLGARVQASLQQGAEGAAWLSGTTALSAIAASAAAALTRSLVATMLISVGVMLLASLGQSARVIAQHPWISSNGWRFNKSQARALMSNSVWLFVLQTAAVVAFQTDLLIVSALLGADQAAVYHGTMRAFALVTLVTTALAAQFWPATAEALASADHEWVRSKHRRLAWQLPALSAGMGLLLVVFGRDMIALWLGESLTPPLSLLIAFALWTTYSSFVLPYSQVLNGAGILRLSAILSILMAAANLLISVALTNVIGVAGPPLGSLVAHTIVLLGPTLLLVRRAWAGQPSAHAKETNG